MAARLKVEDSGILPHILLPGSEKTTLSLKIWQNTDFSSSLRHPASPGDGKRENEPYRGEGVVQAFQR